MPYRRFAPRSTDKANAKSKKTDDKFPSETSEHIAVLRNIPLDRKVYSVSK